MSVWPDLFTAEGNFVSLVPLTMQHRDDLMEAAGDGELHRLWYTMVPEPKNIGDEIEKRLGLRKSGSMLPLTIIEKTSRKAVGMTTFMNIDAANRRLEIGATWFRQSVQRSPLNTESKLLLLEHAFEELDCICVEFRTHFMNIQSRRAIERLGAKLDGVLRSNMVMANGNRPRYRSLLDHRVGVARCQSQLEVATGKAKIIKSAMFAVYLLSHVRVNASPTYTSSRNCSLTNSITLAD